MSISCNKLIKFLDEVHLNSKFYIDRVDLKIYDLAIYSKINNLLQNAEEKGRVKKVNMWPCLDRLKSYTKRQYSGSISLCVGHTISLMQPGRKLIEEISSLLTGCHYNISWIEIAFDIKTSTKAEALELMHLLSEYVVIPSCSQKATVHEANDGNEKKRDSIWYGNKKSKTMFKMYLPLDGEDKPFSTTSLHTEILIRDTQKMQQMGIWNLEDLLSLNLGDWYQQQVKLYGIHKTEVGTLLAKYSDTGKSTTAAYLFNAKLSYIPQLPQYIFHHRGKCKPGLRLHPRHWIPKAKVA